jgi:lipoyl(octanoyl) transferase
MIQYIYLGRVAYDDGLKLQAEIAALRLAGRVDNVLLLLEHPPVLTLGRNARRENVLASDELLAKRGVTLHEINRGGDVTYHGPGQLVGYPIFDLRTLVNVKGGRLGPVDFVRMMEEALIRVCGVYGVRAGRIAGLTGVWCGVSPPEDARAESDASGPEGQLIAEDFKYGLKPVPSTVERGPFEQMPQPSGAMHVVSTRERKIGAIGIHVSRGITSHGFAFNVATDLRDFQLINPCGITDKPVTSLEQEIGQGVSLPGLEEMAHQTARQFGQVFGQQVLEAESLHALRAQAAMKPEIPAEDTPLQVPSEVKRLHGDPERPVRA